MRKLILTIGLAALLPLALPAQAQTNIVADLGSTLGNITNYSVAAYGTYSERAPVGKSHLGGGTLLLYNVNNYVGAGIGLDWLGQLYIVSGTVQFQLPLRPLTFVGLTNFTMVPFVGAAIGTPYGGAGNGNGGVATEEFVGNRFHITKISKGSLGISGAFGNRTGVGDYSGKEYHVGVDYKVGF